LLTVDGWSRPRIGASFRRDRQGCVTLTNMPHCVQFALPDSEEIYVSRHDDVAGFGRDCGDCDAGTIAFPGMQRDW